MEIRSNHENQFASRIVVVGICEGQQFDSVRGIMLVKFSRITRNLYGGHGMLSQFLKLKTYNIFFSCPECGSGCL